MKLTGAVDFLLLEPDLKNLRRYLAKEDGM